MIVSKRFRGITAALTVAAATLAVTACTPIAGGGPGAAGGDSTSALAQIQQRGTLKVADCLSFAPFGFKNDQGHPDGYDIDIANAMAKDLGVKLEVTDTTSANRIPNLQTGKVDLVICNFTRNGERAKQIEFTDPYVVASQALLVKKDSTINTVQDLEGKTVAAVKGSTNTDVLKKVGSSAKTQDYDSSAAAILAVQQGQADAFIEDTNFLAYQAKLDNTLRVTKDQLVPLEYNAMGIKQGDQVWLNWVNQFLFRYNASGENAKAYQERFGVKQQYPLNPQY
ncbi:transporter substrate-binding domain-containing protein [Pseudarthrobacter psychrotolerans]|uniref:Transporter substrate-binding domain-containing protein n=1 Tax=Pseudarthrobacter psychrotolerans TaxID=2697569 RepID=A0A6P1NID0_9MICC|nr:transporter substrate-binding domain-containing protein [Pseudarthrobacter psychrotolerans]QHK18567.1 transporter substrate-binding domain-containing protein [Pseudarthrobacter psychrotolerans]